MIATTALFVELIVIGSGATAAALLVAVITYGLDAAAALVSGNALATLAVIVATYLFGILIDRFADLCFRPLSNRLRQANFGSGVNLRDNFEFARLAVIREPELAARLSYGRSRLRICRGWSVNSILLIVAVVLAAARNPVGLDVRKSLIWTLLALAVLAMACVAAWYALAKAEFREINAQVETLQQEANEKE